VDTHRFTGRTAVVTGAGSGIGRATALRLAGEGATVVAVDLSARRLEALVAGAPRLPLFPVLADLTDEGAVGRVPAAAEGRLDVLVNNAGIMDRFESVAEVDDATWDRVFAVNVGSVMRLTRAAGFMQNIPYTATAEQVAAVIAFLASDDASNVNGVIMPSDGGWSAV
jgi:NAD(P)-dependent dehydrogenase (short-subunit alcohol dehydrogenase family)